MKYSFKCDYSEGAHPRILQALKDTNLTQETGYGEDSITNEAVQFIHRKLNNDHADIHLVSGGTQANIIALASMMKPYESVIAAQTAHINMHEAGGIEATGHKIEAVETKDGKLSPDLIKPLVALHEDEHMTKPKVVFISDSTEIGTHYTKEDLTVVSAFCRKHNLFLYLDGARIGSALAVNGSDKTLADVANLVDIFYIGGTKNGALLGEAMVVLNDQLKDDFRRHIKQRGGLLAKGRVLGVQFRELFRDSLYFDLAKHANEMAQKLVEGITQMGYNFLTDSETNQIFPIFPDTVIQRLEPDYGFYVWEKVNEQSSAIRLVTSWATDESAVAGFLEDLRRLHAKN